MRFIEFFSGIGGFRLGMEVAGHECIAYSEIDPYACAVYNRRFPGTLNLGDVGKIPPGLLRQLDADCWVGGFPCQPFSVAGKQRGESDERHLWPIWFDAIRKVRPGKLLLENVPGLFVSESGGTFNRILSDLASAGYDAEWATISAADIGAPHLRKRVWIVAYADRIGRDGGGLVQNEYRTKRTWRDKTVGRKGGNGVEIRPKDRKTPRKWLPEPEPNRMVDGVPKQLDRLKCLGNAVVPQVVEWIASRLI